VEVNWKDAPMLGSNVLAASSGGGGFSGSTLILILIVVVAFYLLLIRPQQRRKAAAAQRQNDILPGTRVRTTAGMYATVVEVDGDDVILEIAPGIEARYMRRAIMDVVAPAETVEDDEVALADEAEETSEPEYYAAEGEDGDADDTDETADTAVHSDTTVLSDTAVHSEATVHPEVPVHPEVAADADETAYEQATGAKKD
jgi:preprotein translocase subunit YajC